MILGLVIGLFAGATVGILVACLLISAAQGDEQIENTLPDPYESEARQERIDRALARENVVPLGHIRLGRDKATHFDDVHVTRRWHP